MTVRLNTAVKWQSGSITAPSTAESGPLAEGDYLIVVTAACHFKITSAGTAAAATDPLLPPNTALLVHIPASWQLSISPVTGAAFASVVRAQPVAGA